MLIDDPKQNPAMAGIDKQEAEREPTIEEVVTGLCLKGTFRHWDTLGRHYFTLRVGSDKKNVTYRESSKNFCFGIRKLHEATKGVPVMKVQS